MPLYYESHVTIEPVFGAELDRIRDIAGAHRFRVADLLMQKRQDDTPERSRHDTFCTGRGNDDADLGRRMFALVGDLRDAGYKVWRYKIEHVVIDSKVDDSPLRLDPR